MNMMMTETSNEGFTSLGRELVVLFFIQGLALPSVASTL